MSESKHTPGPWKVLGRNVLAKKPFGYVCWCDKQKGQHEANATLIAAAPEMLAALEEFVADMQSVGGLAYLQTEWPDLGDTFTHALAVVAKATGERI